MGVNPSHGAIIFTFNKGVLARMVAPSIALIYPDEPRLVEITMPEA